jgi:peptide/nickel transport system permease protein
MRVHPLVPWLGGRLLRLAILLPVAAVAAFLLVSASPIDPVDAYVDAAALSVGPEQRAAIAARWGLDRPPHERLLAWAAAVASGDLGVSRVFAAPVSQVIADRFAASAWLLAGAWIASGVVGFGLGVQ